VSRTLILFSDSESWVVDKQILSSCCFVPQGSICLVYCMVSTVNRKQKRGFLLRLQVAHDILHYDCLRKHFMLRAALVNLVVEIPAYFLFLPKFVLYKV
jgi:hypothetical protein